MARATEDALDALHALTVKKLTEALKKDEVSPQMISAAIKMLKENGIDTPARSARIDGLAQALRDLDDDELMAEKFN